MSQAFAQITGLAGPSVASARAYSNGRRAMQITLVATYPFFLAATVLRRLNPVGVQAPRVSIFAEARARAAAIIPFIFMG